jgi:1,5-anhydro-D-fructose reductase (1,5-anhydro-D-mannitol-forming)
MKSLRWGLIGAFTIGREWVIDAIRQTGGDIACVFSTDKQRGAAYASEFGISRSTTDLGDLLDSPIDALYISTTNDLHNHQCTAAAKAGKHILCEKPLATNLADAVNMVKVCKAANVVLATNHHLARSRNPSRNAGCHQIRKNRQAACHKGRPCGLSAGSPAGLAPDQSGGRRGSDPRPHSSRR